ncbi:MAG: hypothetical protein U1E77_10460 [Inhella sp.]
MAFALDLREGLQRVVGDRQRIEVGRRQRPAQQQGNAHVQEEAAGVRHVRGRDAFAPRQEGHGVRAAGGHVPEARQRRAFAGQGAAQRDLHQQRLHRQHAQQGEGLVHGLGAAAQAHQRRIGELEQCGRHGHVVVHQQGQALRVGVVGLELGLYGRQQFGAGRDLHPAQQGAQQRAIDLAGDGVAVHGGFPAVAKCRFLTGAGALQHPPGGGEAGRGRDGLAPLPAFVRPGRFIPAVCG